MGIERTNEFWPEWRISELLGEGSYGKVYKAIREEHSITSFCAIKVISVPKNRAELDSLLSEGMTKEESLDFLENIVSDFINEIKLMETLKGTANAVSVEDYRILEKNNGEIGWDIFIRMELLEPFSNRMLNMSEDELVKMGIDICSALELCSKYNIIHRDIKPANIFISKNGDYKLGDFGVARELGKTTGAMSTKGTYSYMAPEVANHLKYDSSVDIYSLGIVMYTILNNNRPPFVDPNAVQITYNDRMDAANRRLTGAPLPPPKNANKHLADIILRACQYKPENRYKNATAFKNALLEYRKLKNRQTQKRPAEQNPDVKVIRPAPKPAPKPVSAPAPKPTPKPAPKPVNSVASPVNNYTVKKQKKKGSGFIIAIVLLILALIAAVITGLIIAIPVIIGISQSTTQDADLNNLTPIYSSDENYQSINSGTSWKLEGGTLTISGSGELPDYSHESELPWYNQRRDITSIYIDEGITSIGSNMFQSVIYLTDIYLPDSLEYIGENAFTGCSSLEYINFPDNLRYIGPSAFSSCYALKSIVIPSNVETVDSWAFAFCDDLESVEFYGEYTTVEDFAFYDSTLVTIYCYDSSSAYYYAEENSINYQLY
ncbi:MAG: leucine-rich repeat protein [Clostridia bacterium]|nr:leucine-rich repeat protein [Clostridia bacterium]